MKDEKNNIRYAAIYSMIISLYQKGKIDKKTAEKINKCCAEQLECDVLTID